MGTNGSIDKDGINEESTRGIVHGNKAVGLPEGELDMDELEDEDEAAAAAATSAANDA